MILLLCQIQLFAQTFKQKIDNQLLDAEIFVKQGRNLDAFEILSPIIKRYKNPKAIFLRALAYYNDQNYKSAIKDLKYLSKYQKRNFDAFLLLSKCYQDSKKYSKSIQILEYLVARQYVNDTILYNLSNLYYQNNQLELALENIQKIAEQSKESIFLQSKILISMGEEIESLKLLNSMSENQKNDKDFLLLRGLSYCNSELYEYAIDDFSLSLDMGNKDLDVYFYRGICYYKKGETQKAIADLLKSGVKGQRYINDNNIKTYGRE